MLSERRCTPASSRHACRDEGLGPIERRRRFRSSRRRRLKARAYDGDLARIVDRRLTIRLDRIQAPSPIRRWISIDRSWGPYLAEGATAMWSLHRAAIALCKRAQLLPAAIGDR